MRRDQDFSFILAAVVLVVLVLGLHVLFPGRLSQDSDRLQLVSLALVLAYLAAGLGTQGWKKSEAMRAVMGWGLVAVVLLAGYSFRHELQPLWGRVRGEFLPTRALTIAPYTVEITKANNNHFEVQASVNSTPCLLLIDTGATNLTLSAIEAKRIGIDVAKLQYTIPLQTANGPSWAAAVTLDSVTIGPIRVENVKAHITSSGLGRGLLGMSFLSRLRSYTVFQDKMVLKAQTP